jgi:hypothetical protein
LIEVNNLLQFIWIFTLSAPCSSVSTLIYLPNQDLGYIELWFVHFATGGLATWGVKKGIKLCCSYFVVLCVILCDPLWFNDLIFTAKLLKGISKIHKGLFQQPQTF